MGGADKGLILLKGRPLAAWVLERLRPQVQEVIIAANRNRDRYEALDATVVADDSSGYAGPLAGLQAALQAASCDLVATVPCDCPLLAADLVDRLYAGMLGHAAEVAVARGASRIQPLFCLCRRSVLPALRDYLASGARKAADWYVGLAIAEVGFDDVPEAFRNVNTPADLADLEALL